MTRKKYRATAAKKGIRAMAAMKIGEETFNVEVEGPEGAPWLIVSNSLGTTLNMWDAQMPAPDSVAGSHHHETAIK